MIPGLQYYEEKFGVSSQSIIKPGLEAMKEALGKLGNPQKNVRFVHIAGTNGKGSTLTYVESLALAHGLKVGAFLSPAIETVHDQLRINGEAITEKHMNAVFERLQQAGISGICTEFELLTCAAFVLFEQQQVDLAVVEAGLGGRLDSTNVLHPIVSIIPSIALEHTNFLGDTLADIAGHKAGIIKEGAPAIIGEVDDAVYAIFEREAQSVGTCLERFGNHFKLLHDSYLDDNYCFDELTPGMLGKHQLHNASLAIRAFSHLMPLDQTKVLQAIGDASLPFRFEQVTSTIYFDGAHNPASAKKLVETIAEHFPQKRVQFVVGMLADKNVKQVLKTLERVSDDFVFVDFHNERAQAASLLLTLSEASQKRIEKNVVQYLLRQANHETLTIVTGSLYLLASLRVELLQRMS